MAGFSFFRRKRKAVISNRTAPGVATPVKGGRSSLSEAQQDGQANILSLLNVSTKNKYREYIKAIENLVKFNNDFGLALDNITSLANTPFSIEFDKGVNDEQSKEMIADIHTCAKEWYNYSEGIHSLVGDLLTQIIISGALSSEMIPENNLDGVKKVVLVDPKDIVFKYDTEQDVYKPYQQVRGLLVNNVLNLNELNPVTYKYYGIRRINENPIAIPPLMTALESTVIEQDMVCNLKHVTKKLGALGFLKVMVDAPKRKPSQSDKVYQAELMGYLNTVVPQIEKGLASNYLVGFKDSFDVDMQSVTSNVQGAKDLFNLVSEMKMSGLKQDPLMLGRNFNTTETLGRVLLAKLTKKLTTYQGLVAAFLEDLFKMHLLLRGFQFESLKVTFEAAMFGDRLKEEEAREKKIANENSLYNQGVISQQDRAEALGYDEPDEEEPRQSAESNSGGNQPANQRDVTEVTED